MTELASVSASAAQSSRHTITPINIHLGDSLANVEGMLVNFSNTLTVNQNEFLAANGELALSSSRHEVPSKQYAAGLCSAIVSRWPRA